MERWLRGPRLGLTGEGGLRRRQGGCLSVSRAASRKSFLDPAGPVSPGVFGSQARPCGCRWRESWHRAALPWPQLWKHEFLPSRVAASVTGSIATFIYNYYRNDQVTVIFENCFVVLVPPELGWCYHKQQHLSSAGYRLGLPSCCGCGLVRGFGGP